jgi:hypothetical protein
MIELSWQTIVLSSCFPLVRFRGVDRCTGNRSAVFHLAHHSPQRIEQLKRLVVLHRISLNNERSRVVTSAIEPPRATSLGAQPARDNAGFVRSSGASSSRTASASRLTRSRKPLFFGPKSHFNLQRQQPDTDATRAVIQSDLVQPWVPHWPTSSFREFLPAQPNSETATQIAVERIPETCVAIYGAHCNARVTKASRQLQGFS